MQNETLFRRILIYLALIAANIVMWAMIVFGALVIGSIYTSLNESGGGTGTFSEQRTR